MVFTEKHETNLVHGNICAKYGSPCLINVSISVPFIGVLFLDLEINLALKINIADEKTRGYYVNSLVSYLTGCTEAVSEYPITGCDDELYEALLQRLRLQGTNKQNPLFQCILAGHV